MRPIQKGDLALVIDGVLGTDSPNIGKEVTVGFLRGQHSKLGNVWRVHSTNLITELGVVTDELDMAQSWLKRIIPPEPVNALEVTDELTND